MSKVQGAMKCVKYLLYIFNFIFWLGGSLVLAVGLWLRFDPDTRALFSEENAPDTYFLVFQHTQQTNVFSSNKVLWAEWKFLEGVYILIGVGGLMMLVGFFGCCGTVRESQCLLGSFFACLLIIFGAEVAAGIFGFLNKDKIIEEVQGFYSESEDENNNSTVVNMYHKVLDCCGSSTSNNSLCPETDPKPKDCEEAIKDFLNSKLYIIGYVGIGIAGIMIIGMIFSMVLCCAIRNNREVI